MATGILRIQAFAARQSSPIEGVTVNVSGDGFTATRLTDAEGNAADVTLTTPACALSLDENNTTQAPYAVCSLVASKPGYRTVRIQGVQVFPGQVTLAQPEMIPDTEEVRAPLNAPIIIPPHSLFTGNGGSGPTPALACTPRVLYQGHRPQEHHRPPRPPRRIGPERHRLLPQVYRQCGVQRGVSYLA